MRQCQRSNANGSYVEYESYTQSLDFNGNGFSVRRRGNVIQFVPAETILNAVPVNTTATTHERIKPLSNIHFWVRDINGAEYRIMWFGNVITTITQIPAGTSFRDVKTFVAIE